MPEKENFVRTEFALKAVFTHATGGETTFYDIVSISATFALNSIPIATLVVAYGNEVQSGAPATIHKALEKLKPRDKVKVTLVISSNDGDTTLMPSGKGVIFEGYYAGAGYQRSNTSASYTLHLIHWLDDLNCASMINGNWHPGVPHDLAQAANMDAALMHGGAGAHATSIIDPKHAILKMTNMEADLWGRVLKPVFEEIAQFHPPSIQESGRDPDLNGMAVALAALARMPGKAPNPATLPLSLGSVNQQAIEDGVREHITLMATNNMAYSSFWSKLIGEFAPAFLFAVSPCAEFANVIPFFGGLSETWKEIDGREYTHANFNSNLSSLIESIEIRYRQTSGSDWMLVGGPALSLSYYFPWGRFPFENADLRGQIIVKDPPGWLAAALPSYILSAGSTGMGPRLGDCCAAGKGPPPPAGVKRATEVEKNIAESHIPDLLCEHWYKTEILSQRYGELSGKLRFDIAPGSMVKIKEPAVGTLSEVAVYAAVTHVSFLINAEQHTAGTSFTLVNLRTELENKDTKIYTRPEPPLYQKSTWRGGVLAEFK